SMLNLQLDSNFLNSNLKARGQWRLAPGYPGEATATFSEISLGAVRDWLSKPGERTGLNFDGVAEGKVTIAGPALGPADWKGSVELTKLEVFPNEQNQPPGTARFTMSNQGPVALTVTNSRVAIQSARFTGAGTDLTIAGSALLRPQVSLD